MPKLKPNFFLDSISHLRTHGHLIISDDLLKTTRTEDDEIVLYLEQEFEKECLTLPIEAPQFSAKAALWAAKIVYYASLLLLHRKDTKKELEVLFPNFDGPQNVSTILSVDLTLRYLPQIYMELESIDHQDPLVGIIKTLLEIWQYSSIRSNFKVDEINTSPYLKSPVLKQLFLDRIVNKKALNWAQDETINPILVQYLGFYKNDIWKALQPIKNNT